MANDERDDDPRVYQALALPAEAISDGGLEILRVGIINDAIYISARRGLEDPAQWGEVLADVAKHVGGLYAAEVPGLSRKDVTVQIAQAFAALMGAKPVAAPAAKTAPKPRPRPTGRRTPARAKPSRRKR